MNGKLQKTILNMNFIVGRVGKMRRENYFYNVLLRAQHCNRHFICIVSFAVHHNLVTFPLLHTAQKIEALRL